jgi:hypothetical protein
MQFSFRVTIHHAIVVLMFVLGLSAPGGAQTMFEPGNFDVAGVKIGMTLDEAAAAIKAFDPGFTITKRYLSRPGIPYGADGDAIDNIPLSDRSTSYLDSLYAIKGAATQECRPMIPGATPQCFDRHPDDEEVVKVWFARIPGQERVIAVQRAKTFYKEPKPAIAALKDGVLAKYGKDQFTYDTSEGWTETISWIFDGRRRLISAESARSKRIGNIGGLPRLVNAGDGITLNVVFTGNNRNNQIAESFLVTLADGDGLFKSVDQSKAAYAALKARANALELEKASKTQSQTKF